MEIDTPTPEQGSMTRTYRYEDEIVVATDLGPTGPDASVEVLGDVAIVVDGDEHHELAIPGPISEAADPEAFIRNGVLTFEVSTDQ